MSWRSHEKLITPVQNRERYQAKNNSIIGAVIEV